MELVQIQINAHRGSKEYREEYGLITDARPKEVTDVVDALSRMWGRLGVHEICKLCFAGKLDRAVGSHGCCGGCPNLGHSKCMAKPISCATYFCGAGISWKHKALEVLNISKALPETMALVYHSLFGWGRVPQRGCFSTAVRREAKEQWTDVELKQLRVARYAIEAWEQP